MIGSTLDKYVVLQRIGEGGMATVYRGRHTALGRDVAIKILHPHLSVSTRNRHRFAREARAIEHLRHQNILEIHDYSGENAEDCYIVTELVDGETLSDVLTRTRKVPSEVAALIGIALADALAYAHKAGILHRDLKPENVMLRRDGVVKLMDFGIARFLDESQVTMTGALVGSPAYMSPEQAREEELDGRSDLFSLGTLLFHLVSGELPFHGHNPSVVLKNVIEGNRPTLVEVMPTASASLADVIERLLAPGREDRYASAADVRTDLAACLSELGLDPTEPRWSLARWHTETDPYERDLDAWLRTALITRGRALAAQGDHLGAVRLLNRLLSMDEGNAEALALLEEFHGVRVRDATSRRWPAAAAALIVLGVFGALASWRGTTPDPRPVSPPAPHDADSLAVVARPELPELAPSDAQVPPTQAPTAPPTPQPLAVAPAPEPQRPSPPVTGTARRVADPGTVTPAPVPVAPLVDDRPACVALRSPDVHAEIWFEDRLLRTTRDRGCSEVPAGTRTFVLRGPMVAHERTITLELAPGEVRDREIVKLERLPARVRFGPDLRASCVVSVDGTARGTLADLDRSVEVAHPERPHQVSVRCGSDTSVQTFASLDYPEILFDPSGSP